MPDRPRFVVACVDGWPLAVPLGRKDGGRSAGVLPRSCSILDRLNAHKEVARYDSGARRSPDQAQALAEYDAHLLNEWDGHDDGSPSPRLYGSWNGGPSRTRHYKRALAWAEERAAA